MTVQTPETPRSNTHSQLTTLALSGVCLSIFNSVFLDFSINVVYYFIAVLFFLLVFLSVFCFLFFVSRFCSELEVELVFLLDFLGWVSRLEEGSCGAKPSPAQLSEAKHSRQSITNHLIQSRVILVPAFVQYRKRLLRFWRSITNMLAVNYNNLNLEFHLDWIKPVIVCRSLGYLISTVPRR